MTNIKQCSCLFMLFITLINFKASAQMQKPSFVDGVLSFNSRMDFDNWVEADEATKKDFFNSLSEQANFQSLYSAKTTQNSLPDSLIESVEFVSNILNQHGVVKIGNYYYKIDYSKGAVFSMHESQYPNGFNDLLNGTKSLINQIGQFDLESDVIDLTEAGYKGEPSEFDTIGALQRTFCWRGDRTRNDRRDVALFLKDLSEPQTATFADCVNVFDGRPITNRRLKVKLEYLSLGI